MDGAAAGTEFPIYDGVEGIYRLYDLGVNTWDPSTEAKAYAFRFSNTADRQAAADAMHGPVYGRVKAVVYMSWNDNDGYGNPQSASKYLYYNDSFMDKYVVKPSSQAFKAVFTGLDTKEGPITAVPMFIVYDSDGRPMFTLSGSTWTLK